MHNITLLEEYYKRYTSSLSTCLPEGLVDVNLTLLQELDLLHYHNRNRSESTLTRYFHVIESYEKITLINEDFVIWIVPDKVNEVPVTYCLIALNQEDFPILETGFLASGVYNTSKLVLNILEKFLFEIQENEDLLDRLSE